MNFLVAAVTGWQNRTDRCGVVREAPGGEFTWGCSTDSRAGVGASEGGVESDARHLADWAASHRGVEAYIEPETTVTELTVVLVAYDGEGRGRARSAASGRPQTRPGPEDPRLRRAQDRIPQAARIRATHYNGRRIERKRERQREL